MRRLEKASRSTPTPQIKSTEIIDYIKTINHFNIEDTLAVEIQVVEKDVDKRVKIMLKNQKILKNQQDKLEQLKKTIKLYQ